MEKGRPSQTDAGGDRVRSGGPDAEERPLGLTELARAAGVSVRTVRYYIAEGLLPPPVGAGPHSAYTTGHLDRLRLIGHLKAAYLPLREIRRRLSGLDDGAVRDLLARTPPGQSDLAAAPARAAPPHGPDSAAAYLDRVLGRRPAAVAETVAPWHGVARSPAPDPPERGDPPRRGSAVDHGPPSEIAPDLAEPDLEAPATDHDDAATWRRIRLADDAELLVREEAYQRRRDRIDWLIAWARKVIG